MKKSKILSLLLSLGLCFSFNYFLNDNSNVVVNAEDDFANATSVDLNNLSKQIVKNNGEALSLKDMELDLLCGNVLGKVSKFTNYIQEENGNVLISNDTKFEGEASASFAPWRFKTTSAQSAIFKIKATSDIKLTISHPEITTGWIDEHGQYFALYVNTNNKTYMQWSKDIKQLPVEANSYGGEVMLKKGDVAYYVFGSTIANERNVQTIPVFTSSTADYNETIRNEQLEFKGSEKINMWDAITNTINNDYQPCTYNSLFVGFYYGTLLDYQLFSYHEGDGSGSEHDALWTQVAHGDGGTGFLRWQIQCDENKDAIIIYKALLDTNVTITHRAVWDNAWPKHTAIRYYGMDEEGNKLLIKEYPIIDNSGADYFKINVNLKANESLIMDYYSINGQWGSLDFAPVITSDTTLFDESKTLDFSVIKKLAKVKEEKIAALDELFNGLDEADYSLNNWGNIENYYNEAVNAIKNAQDEQALLDTYNSAVSSINGTKTLTQERDELTAYRNAKAQELEDYYNAINKKDYSEENYQIITDKVNEFKGKILKATSKTSVNTLYKNVTSQIEKIEKKQSGCSGSVGLSFISLTSLLSLLLLKKKK